MLIAPSTGIIKPQPWPVDPLLTANPELWRNLCVALPLWEGGRATELISGTDGIVVNADPVWEVGICGPQTDHYAATTNRGWRFLPQPNFNRPSTAITVMLLAGARTSGDYRYFSKRSDQYSSASYTLLQRVWSTNYDTVFGLVIDGHDAVETGSGYCPLPSSGDMRWMVGRWYSGSPLNLRHYDMAGTLTQERNSVSSYTGNIYHGTGTWASGYNQLLVSAYYQQDQAPNAARCRLGAAMVFDRYLDDAALAQILTDPFGPIRPAGRPVSLLTPSAPVGPIYAQAEYRARNDDGSEAAATWKATADTPWNQAIGQPFRVRVRIENSGATATPKYGWQYTETSGGEWSDMPPQGATGVPVRYADSSYLTDAGATTQQLGSGSFDAGRIYESDHALSVTMTADGEAEVEGAFELVSGQISVTDKVWLRVVREATE